MKKYLIILVCVLLCGCVSTKKVRNQSLEVAKFDIEKFNGNYANYTDSISKGYLFNKLYPENRFGKTKHYPTEDAIMNFEFNGKKTLMITITDMSGVPRKIKFKGKIKNNYFSVRRRLFVIPVPILCYFHEETKILLGNDKNGNLVLKIGYFGAGWVIMAASREYTSQSQFKKLK